MRKKGRIITDFQGTTYSAELPKGNYHHTEGGGWWQMRPPSPHDSRTMNVRKSCADRGGSSAPVGFDRPYGLLKASPERSPPEMGEVEARRADYSRFVNNRG